MASFHTWLWKCPIAISNPNPNPIPNPNPNPPTVNSFPNPHPNPNFPVSSADVDASFQLSRSPKAKKSGTVTSGHKVYGSARREGRRRNQSLDLDFDMVIVQPDYMSGSESEGSDWSVGWFEPHAPEFCSDGEAENSFAVLVPCYCSPSLDEKAWCVQEEAVNPLFNANSKSQLWLSNFAKDSHAETNFYLQQWVSSLRT